MGLPDAPGFLKWAKVSEVNVQRQRLAPGHKFTGESSSDPALKGDASLAVGYITRRSRWRATWKSALKSINLPEIQSLPRTSTYISIDEVVHDVTCYLAHYGVTARELACAS
jgi:DNA polymerase V